MVHKISFKDVSLIHLSQNQILSDISKLKILLCEFFALDHQNYWHYGAFQHVNLQSLRKEDEDWFNELNEKRFVASLTGYVFSTIHSDLVTELFNKETKDTSGLFRRAFSTNADSVNTWINSIHIHTMLKVA